MGSELTSSHINLRACLGRSTGQRGRLGAKQLSWAGSGSVNTGTSCWPALGLLQSHVPVLLSLVIRSQRLYRTERRGPINTFLNA